MSCQWAPGPIMASRDRDAKILEIFEGANEVLQWVIARQLIGRDVTG